MDSRASRRATRQILGQALLASDDVIGGERQPQQQQQQQQELDNSQQRVESRHNFFSAPAAAAVSSSDLTPANGSMSPDYSTVEDARKSPELLPKGNGSAFHLKQSTSVKEILQQLATGNTIGASSKWNLTRAVIHIDDAWHGRISPCPPLEHERVLKLFKLKWKYRWVEFFLVHMFLALSLVEVPAWCVRNRKCFWSCYPDFSRNWHMTSWMSLLIEGSLLGVLVVISLVDVHVSGREYWLGTRGVHFQTTWFKHGTIALYTTVFCLAVAIDFRAHALCGYLRVLLYLSVHRRTMVVITQLRHILGAVAEIWLLIFLNIVLFAWVGMVLFSGTPEGEAAFPDMFEAGWRLFVLFTTTNFPDIMMAALDSVRATFIYFAGFVLLNVFFLAPLSLAFIFNVFRGGQKGIPRMEEDIRLNSTVAAFALLDDRGTGQISISNMGAFLLEVHTMRGLACRELARLQDLIEEAGVRRPEEPSLDLADFKDAVTVMDRSLIHAEWITEIQWYFPRTYQSSFFRRLTWLVKHQRVTLWPSICGTPKVSMLVMDFIDACLLTASFITLFVANSSDIKGGIVRYDWVQIFIVMMFCITVTLSAIVRGWHNCVQRPTWVFNVVITLASFLIVCLAFTGMGEKWGWRVMRAFRVVHLSLGIAFVPRLGFLVRTLIIMTKRAATPASVLLAWAFLMAELGTQIFGGTVCVPILSTLTETCGDVYVADNAYTDAGMTLLNFNDVPTAIVTLFVLFVVNDWYVIVDEFVDVTGTGWARLFFIVNYIIGVAVILNLVVTVVINSFWDEYKNTNRPSLALRQVHDAAAASAQHAPVSTVDDTGHGGGGVGGGGGGGGGGSVTGGGGDEMTASRLDRQTFPIVDEDIHGRRNTANSVGSSSAAMPTSARDIERWDGRGGDPNEEAGDERGVAGGLDDVGYDGGHAGGAGLNAREQRMPSQAHVVRVDGDQGGMEAERQIARRASRRRVDVSGIT